MTLTELFTNIADSLRSKTGRTDKISAADFPSVIEGLSIGTEGGIIPTGTKSITTNGTHDVTSYASASVNVPVGITPSGTKTISENGTFDVTNFVSANVNVPQNAMVFPVTFSSNIGGGTLYNQTVITGNDFVKNNYSKDGFYGILMPLFDVTASPDANTVFFMYQGNRVIVHSKSIGYGMGALCKGSATNSSAFVNTTKISGSGYLVSFRATSNGNVNLYCATTYTIPAGNYLIILGVAE